MELDDMLPGDKVLWVGEAYSEPDIDGTVHTVRRGDIGTVIDNSPQDIVVDFPGVGTLAPPRACLAPAEAGEATALLDQPALELPVDLRASLTADRDDRV